MTFTIDPFIVLTQNDGTLVWWNHSFNLPFQQIIDKMLCRVTAICQQAVKLKAFKQLVGLSNVMPMSARQGKAQGVAQTIDCDMDFTTKATTTASKSLFTVFFRHLLHRDAHEQSCCQSSHFPYRDRLQNSQTFFATHPFYTIVQTAYRLYSSFHNRLGVNAIVRHFGSPISQLRQNCGRLLRLCLHKHSGLII